jgi:hypothetical protein
MPTSQWKPRLFAKTFHYSIVSTILAAAAIGGQTTAKPRPHGFTAVPAPSSLLLVVTGMLGLLGWNWWRRRSLQNRGRKEASALD